MGKQCDLYTDAARLRDAFDDLIAMWRTTQESWNDEISRKFAEERLEPLGPLFKQSLDAVSRMSQIVEQMVQQCES